MLDVSQFEYFTRFIEKDEVVMKKVAEELNLLNNSKHSCELNNSMAIAIDTASWNVKAKKIIAEIYLNNFYVARFYRLVNLMAENAFNHPGARDTVKMARLIGSCFNSFPKQTAQLQSNTKRLNMNITKSLHKEALENIHILADS